MKRDPMERVCLRDIALHVAMALVLFAALGLSLAVFALLQGCSVDPMEKLSENIESKSVEVRLTSVKELSKRDDRRSRDLLIEALETDEELLESAGNALVLIGRRFDESHPIKKQTMMYPNPVLRDLGNTAAKKHLEWPIRAKAVWALGEIGNRKAKPFITGAYGADSTRVTKETAMALDKLGFTNKGVAYELLREGQPSSKYHPEKRWRIKQ